MLPEKFRFANLTRHNNYVFPNSNSMLLWVVNLQLSYLLSAHVHTTQLYWRLYDENKKMENGLFISNSFSRRYWILNKVCTITFFIQHLALLHRGTGTRRNWMSYCHSFQSSVNQQEQNGTVLDVVQQLSSTVFQLKEDCQSLKEEVKALKTG